MHMLHIEFLLSIQWVRAEREREELYAQVE